LKTAATSALPASSAATASSLLPSSIDSEIRGLLAHQPFDQARQHAGAMTVHREHTHVALVDALHLADIGGDAALVVAPAPGQGDDQVARRREAHATRQPLEQGHAELAFEREHLPIDRRCGDVQFFRSALDRPGARDLIDISQHDRQQRDAPPGR